MRYVFVILAAFLLASCDTIKMPGGAPADPRALNLTGCDAISTIVENVTVMSQAGVIENVSFLVQVAELHAWSVPLCAPDVLATADSDTKIQLILGRLRTLMTMYMMKNAPTALAPGERLAAIPAATWTGGDPPGLHRPKGGRFGSR